MNCINRTMILKGGADAIHKMGNIGRKDDELIRIDDETSTHFIGHFCEGFGFIGVKFKKDDVRSMTKNEVDALSKAVWSVNGKAYSKNNYDYDGFLLLCSIINK